MPFRRDRRSTAGRRIGAIGNLPRAICGLQFVVFGAVMLIAGAANDHAAYIALAMLPGLPFALSLRVGARIFEDRLVLCSYLRDLTIPFDDVEQFMSVPYQGIWSGFASAQWYHVSQIDVERRGYRAVQSFPSTLTTRRQSEEIEAALNAHVDDWRRRQAVESATDDQTDAT